MVALAERFGDDEDIGKNDCRIEREAAQGLQGDFRRQLRRAHHSDEVMLFFKLPVFGEVAASLAHEPDRWAVNGLLMGGGEETLAWCHEYNNE